MTVKGKTFGRWGQSGWLLSMASVSLRKEIDAVLMECANIYLNEIYQTIATGGYGMWPRLSEDWARRKGGSTFYEYRGDFLSELRIDYPHRGPINYKIFVGVESGKPHPSGLTLGELADVLEISFGRPLFELAWERVEPQINRKLERIGGQVLR